MEDLDGLDFTTRHKRQQEKRRWNREASMRMLREAGVPFTEHNNGSHLIVDGAWDFMPGTGRFNQRNGSAAPGHGLIQGRGVIRLLQHIEEARRAKPV